jgi:hypothetical protein
MSTVQVRTLGSHLSRQADQEWALKVLGVVQGSLLGWAAQSHDSGTLVVHEQSPEVLLLSPPTANIPLGSNTCTFWNEQQTSLGRCSSSTWCPHRLRQPWTPSGRGRCSWTPSRSCRTQRNHRPALSATQLLTRGQQRGRLTTRRRWRRPCGMQQGAQKRDIVSGAATVPADSKLQDVAATALGTSPTEHVSQSRSQTPLTGL